MGKKKLKGDFNSLTLTYFGFYYCTFFKILKLPGSFGVYSNLSKFFKL